MEHEGNLTSCHIENVGGGVRLFIPTCIKMARERD